MKTRQKSRDASGILLVCLMWMLSLSSSLHAQTWNINGNVTDEQGEPIIGANVVIQGTGTGTITDVEGNFKLASVTKGAVMEISFIGYISKTLQVKDASSLKIVLKEDNQALDEVVVVGYGVQRKSDLTGSVASVNSDVLESRPQANLIQSLQGAVPGLNISVTGSMLKVRLLLHVFVVTTPLRPIINLLLFLMEYLLMVHGRKSIPMM